MTAIELSGYYIVPISSDNIKFYIGGGFGLYNGERIHTFANVRASTIKLESNIGIHVMTGIDYNINSRFSVRSELKFRDPHFDVTDKFDQQYTDYLGWRLQIPLRDQQERTTRINLFGVNYMLGLVIRI
jgi:opacity protein-like surface antigen